MNNNDWLAQLAPAHAPPPIGWWPLAPGWVALILFFLLLAAGITYWLLRPQQRMRRAALQELRRLELQSNDDKTLARNIEHLVRRYAIGRFGREVVARLSGKAWVAFVVEHGGKDWAGETGASLLSAAYGGSINGDRVKWLNGARGFLKKSKTRSH